MVNSTNKNKGSGNTSRPLTPREYISWSQLSAYETSPYQYAKRYIYEDNPENPRMKLGRDVAEMLEEGIEQEDKELEFFRTFLPEYPEKEYKIEGEISGIKILGKLDGWDEKNLHIGEYKTGAKGTWNQKRVDEHGQLSFYALLVYLKYGKLPKRITLHWLPTAITPEKGLHLTGDIHHFETTRTQKDLIDIGARIKRAWKGIIELCDEEYKAIGLL